jgi:4a-hydroxytetrahydrobiopterin dehydratase
LPDREGLIIERKTEGIYMTALKNQVCEVCRADSPRVTADEAVGLLTDIPDWQVVDINGVEQLQRRFKFKNFVEALNFTQKIGDLAEQSGHHPAILTEWGRVTVSWWTHKIGGLHRNDFVMAAKTDELLN